MTERIDHARIAAEMTGVAAITQDTEAVTHAILALVEQQRIANLIALHCHEVKHDIGDWSRLYDGEDLKPSIREGLGL